MDISRNHLPHSLPCAQRKTFIAQGNMSGSVDHKHFDSKLGQDWSERMTCFPIFPEWNKQDVSFQTSSPLSESRLSAPLVFYSRCVDRMLRCWVPRGYLCFLLWLDLIRRVKFLLSVFFYIFLGNLLVRDVKITRNLKATFLESFFLNL